MAGWDVEAMAPVIRCMISESCIPSQCKEILLRFPSLSIAIDRNLHDPQFLTVVGKGEDLEINLVDQALRERVLWYRSRLLGHQ